MGRLYEQTNLSTNLGTSLGGRLYEPSSLSASSRDDTSGRLYGLNTSSTTSNVGTVEGLQTLATSTGLTPRLKPMGEKPKEFLSGGWISDIFDILNVAQYGVVGMLKGKGWKEGIKTRQSWSDKDALGDLGLPGVIGGIILDIACDPFTYIAPWTIAKKIPGVAKAVDVIGETAKATKLGQAFGRAFVWKFGADDVYKEMATRLVKSKAISQMNVVDIAKDISKIDPEMRKVVMAARKAGKLSELPEEILKKVAPLYETMDKWSREAIENLPLSKASKEIWENNIGKYVARMYKKFEEPVEAIKKLYPSKKLGISTKQLLSKRKDIPDFLREAWGEITEAGYPTAKKLIQLIEGVENAKFFKKVNKTFGSKLAKEGFEQLPDVKRLGDLAGMYIPKPIFNDIQDMIRPIGEIEKGLNKVVGAWKYGKVILNPGAHGRNAISNMILNSWEGLSPHRLDIYAEGAKEMALYKSGKATKWIKELVESKVGFDINTFAAQEIAPLFKSPEGMMGLTGIKGKIDNLAKKFTSSYGGVENWGKVSQYIFQRKKGLDIVDAWKIAERATFDYSQVTPFIRKLRTNVFGFPFITFSYKAAPQVVKTALMHPGRISYIGKIKNAIESQAGISELTRERATEPSWVRDGFYIKMPMKDKYNRSVYFDMSYIVPFGDLITGEVLKRPPAFFGLVKEISMNRDFYGDKIWKESDPQHKQFGDLFRHLTKTAMPVPISDQIPGGYNAAGEQRQGMIQRALAKEKGGGSRQQRTLMQEMFRNVGLKLQPVDLELQEYWAEQGQMEELQVLLQEAGILKKFERYYIPKNK